MMIHIADLNVLEIEGMVVLVVYRLIFPKS